MDRMQQHFNVLAYLFIGFGALGILMGFLVGGLLTSTGALSGDPEAARVLTAVSGMLWIVFLVFSVPYLLAGYGLLKRYAWGRILGMVLGAFALLSVPIGTALGVYALWALTRPEAEEDFF